MKGQSIIGGNMSLNSGYPKGGGKAGRSLITKNTKTYKKLRLQDKENEGLNEKVEREKEKMETKRTENKWYEEGVKHEQSQDWLCTG